MKCTKVGCKQKDLTEKDFYKQGYQSKGYCKYCLRAASKKRARRVKEEREKYNYFGI